LYAMTIALGIMGGGGVVLAADGQETDGVGFKDYALKIRASLPQPSGIHIDPRSVVAVTGCGPGFQLDALSDEIIALAHSRPDWTLDTCELAIQGTIATFFNRHVQPLLPHLNLLFNLIVAAQFDGQCWMWSTDTTVVKRCYPFEAMGSGKQYAKTAIYTRIIHPNIEAAVLLAIRGVLEAKRFDQYCGQSTTVVCLYKNGAHHIPWYIIEPAEKLFDKYAGIEQSTFQLVLGHFAQDEERKHLGRLSKSLRKLRSEMKEIEGQIKAQLSKG
jgi:20S proteasome alpha/beta subunit